MFTFVATSGADAGKGGTQEAGKGLIQDAGKGVQEAGKGGASDAYLVPLKEKV